MSAEWSRFISAPADLIDPFMLHVDRHRSKFTHTHTFSGQIPCYTMLCYWDCFYCFRFSAERASFSASLATLRSKSR